MAGTLSVRLWPPEFLCDLRFLYENSVLLKQSSSIDGATVGK